MKQAVLLLALAIGLTACELFQSSPSPAPAPAPTPTPVPNPQPPTQSKYRFTDQDRNHDGIVDWQQRVPAAIVITDYFTQTRIDDDFDGYFDRVIIAGGIAGTTREEKIHEKCPPMPAKR